MSNRKAYEIIKTADKSPTLSLAGGEKMHSLDGALSETLEIYGPVIEKSSQRDFPTILSMGLGLGYNEILSLGHLYKRNCQSFTLVSFETVDFLRTQWLAWIRGEKSELESCYEFILLAIANQLEIDHTKNLKGFALQAISKKQLVLNSALNIENSTETRFQGILYDAFSSNTDQNLWSEEHLNLFLTNYSHPEYCLFSTYAATGTLKRSLIENGFTLEKKKGFGKKRESTYAHRIQRA